ncbi:MAG: energy transducer TonB [Helicobacteraceae bacterium]|nr:energy transducer TonB [Helicobacteraceae bacterium]
MKSLLINRNFKAFYLAALCFLPLLFLLKSTTLFKINPTATQPYTLTMQHFSAFLPAQEILAKPIQKIKDKRELKEFKKEIQKPLKKQAKPIKKEMLKPPPQLNAQANTQQPSIEAIPQSSANNTQIVESLSFGKDENPFLKSVKIAIDNSMTYPRVARKMRLEGRVLVEFLWTKNKELKYVRILKSSKHNILDENALNTIRLAKRHFPAYKNDVKLQIPIVYSLR